MRTAAAGNECDEPARGRWHAPGRRNSWRSSTTGSAGRSLCSLWGTRSRHLSIIWTPPANFRHTSQRIQERSELAQLRLAEADQVVDDAQLLDRRTVMQKRCLDGIASPAVVQQAVTGWVGWIRRLHILVGFSDEAVEPQTFQRRRADLLYVVLVARKDDSVAVPD